MIETRIVKIVMVGSLALFAGLVAYDNLTDYQTNYVFVRHVLSMDTTPPGNSLMYRSISSPSLWEGAYALIIACEAATALGFTGAAALLLRHLRSPATSFNRSKGLAAVAAGLGFMVIGGEWFQMWQSSQWNGQQPAFRFYLTILAVLIFVMQRTNRMLSRRAFGTLMGAASCVGDAAASSVPAPTVDLDASSLAAHEAAMRLAIAVAKANPFYPFGAVIVGPDDRAVLAQGVNNTKTNPTLHGEIAAINDYVAPRQPRLGRRHPVHHRRTLPDVHERHRLGQHWRGRLRKLDHDAGGGRHRPDFDRRERGARSCTLVSRPDHGRRSASRDRRAVPQSAADLNLAGARRGAPG